MKYFIAITLALLGVACAGTIGNVDWSAIQPLNLNVAATVPDDARVPEGRITNGNVAAPKQFPYQAGLSLYTTQGRFWCGGTVISDRWILTAAHCTDDLSTGVEVYLGAFNRADPTERNQHIIFVSKKNVIVHENWQPDVLVNDISLIKLPVVLEFNEYLQPAKLPKMSDSYDTYEGQKAFASGWGDISDDKALKGVTDKLRWIEVPIMTNKGCNTWYLGSITPENICIKTTGGFSTCSGDSGGPLVLADGSNTLIGATSFGIALGCEKGWPGVFTRVTSYLDWIAENSGVVNY